MHSLHALERPGNYGPHGELFFFLIKKKPEVVSNEVLPDPFVSVETLKACALIGLHLSSGCQSPDLGDRWKYGCPEGPDWEGDVESWTSSERHLFL